MGHILSVEHLKQKQQTLFLKEMCIICTKIFTQ